MGLCTKDDILHKVQAVGVVSRRQILEYIATFRIKDTHGLGKVVSLQSQTNIIIIHDS